jgi:hypothetical protein
MARRARAVSTIVLILHVPLLILLTVQMNSTNIVYIIVLFSLPNVYYMFCSFYCLAQIYPTSYCIHNVFISDNASTDILYCHNLTIWI